MLSEEYKKSEPFSYRKKVRIFIVWCGRWDLNPHVIDTRTSNVPVCRFQHFRIRQCLGITKSILAYPPQKSKGFLGFSSNY